MSNIVETAKALLKKGIELNDIELINMANSILHSNEKTAELIVVEPQNGENYKCLACSHTFTSEKVKKACPKCKKRKLIIVNSTPIAQPQSEDGVHRLDGSVYNRGSSNKKVTRYDPVTGLADGSYGRTEQIVAKPNSFVDDGSEGQDGALFDKKYGQFFKPSVRKKEAAKPVQVKCGNCNKLFSISPFLFRGHDAYYVCTQCGSHRRS